MQIFYKPKRSLSLEDISKYKIFKYRHLARNLNISLDDESRRYFGESLIYGSNQVGLHGSLEVIRADNYPFPIIEYFSLSRF